MNNVYQRVTETLANHNMFLNTRHVILGLSGGSDSMCLFDILERLSDDERARGNPGFVIHPVHINHGIRKEDAVKDQNHCEAYCKNRGFTCRTFVYDCQAMSKEWGISTEEAGRRLRYDSFAIAAKEIAEEYDEPYHRIVVAIAQNADDQSETVLMRLLRGTGIDGLSGIPYSRSDERGYRIVRPLLDVWKEDILKYCKDYNISYVTDKTNNKPIYHRNKIRLELIPHLEEKYNPNIKEALTRLAKSAREDSEYLKREANLVFDKNLSAGCLDIKGILELDISLRRRVLDLFFKYHGINEGITSEHYLACEELIGSSEASKEIMLPGGNVLYKSYSSLSIDQGRIEDEKVLPIPEIILTDTKELKIIKVEGNKTYAAFDLKKFEEELGAGSWKRIVVRNRLPGDSIRLKMGTKKLQDLLVDDKVPKRERDLAQVVAIGSRVLWFIPYGAGRMRWTAEFAPGEDSERIILIRPKY